MAKKVGVIMFAIDDAHYMDFESWEFVEALGNDKKSVVVVAMKPNSRFYKDSPSEKASEKVLGSKTTKQIQVVGGWRKNLANVRGKILGFRYLFACSFRTPRKEHSSSRVSTAGCDKNVANSRKVRDFLFHSRDLSESL